MMESFKIVGAKIVNLREAKKLTQEQLAEKAEIPIAELRKIEEGSPDATINFYEKIGQVLNFTPAQIFAKTDREHRQQINKIKKLLQAAPVDVLRELEMSDCLKAPDLPLRYFGNGIDDAHIGTLNCSLRKAPQSTR